MEPTELKTPAPGQVEPAPPVPKDAPPYDPPRVLTIQGADIQRELGTAHGCSFNHSVVGC